MHALPALSTFSCLVLNYSWRAELNTEVAERAGAVECVCVLSGWYTPYRAVQTGYRGRSHNPGNGITDKGGGQGLVPDCPSQKQSGWNCQCQQVRGLRDSMAMLQNEYGR